MVVEITRHNGKVIANIEVYETYCIITFTDGTTFEVQARGTEEQWIEYED